MSDEALRIYAIGVGPEGLLRGKDIYARSGEMEKVMADESIRIAGFDVGPDGFLRGLDIRAELRRDVKAIHIDVDGRNAPCLVRLDLIDGSSVHYVATSINVFCKPAPPDVIPAPKAPTAAATPVPEKDARGYTAEDYNGRGGPGY